jgi:MFS family permease
MTATFPGVKEEQVGLCVGLIASAFALAQFTTNFFWGWLSDRIGRKPVILCGTILTAACFGAFGFCKTLWQAILVQVCLGLVNGNQGLIATCLGEVTDRSNQSKAFTYLPVIYGLGGITGPALGGLLVLKDNPFRKGEPNPYPYALPNLVSALVLIVDAVLIMVFLEESLDGIKDQPPLGQRVHHFFSWLWQFVSLSHHPTYLQGPGRRHKHRHARNATQSESSGPSLLLTANDHDIKTNEVFKKDTVLILITYLIFQLSNIAYNSLYPIFGEAKPPTGRNLSTEEIGLSMAFAGALTIGFQIFFYGGLRERLGNRASYRLSLGLFVIAYALMPFVGYKEKSGIGQGKVWVWVELGTALIIKTIAAVGGLTSALLLVCLSSMRTKCAALNLLDTDYQFRSEPCCPRETKWPCADPISRWTCCGAFHIRSHLLSCKQGPTKR